MSASAGSRMTVTRSEARRRPSRRRSHDVTPSRSARSRGARPSSASQASTSAGAQADARGAMDMRGSLPEAPWNPDQEPSEHRGDAPASHRHEDSVADHQQLVGLARPRLALHGAARADGPRTEVGGAALLADLHVAAESGPPRNHRLLAHDRDPGVEATGLLLVRRV